ncbi:hypothetical protein BOX15_Mlig025386g1, partial [Macrostomum lignano]
AMSTYSNGTSTLPVDNAVGVGGATSVGLECLLSGLDFTDSANSSGFFDATSFSSLDDSFNKEASATAAALTQSAVANGNHHKNASGSGSGSSRESPGGNATAGSALPAFDGQFGQLEPLGPEVLQSLLFADSPIKPDTPDFAATAAATNLGPADFASLFASLQQPQQQQQQQPSLSSQTSWPPDDATYSGRHTGFGGRRSLAAGPARPITGQRSAGYCSYGQPHSQQQKLGTTSQRSPGLSPSSAWTVTSKWQQRHGGGGSGGNHGSWSPAGQQQQQSLARRSAQSSNDSWSANPLDSLRACLDSQLLDSIDLLAGVDGLGAADPGPAAAACYYGDGGVSSSLREERYSRKVFVGGLPPDIDEDEITNAFRRFGVLVIDWPHKNESRTYFPPKGYCFILFQEESSVQSLMEACIADEGKFYWCVSSPTMKDKPVQIRPWNLADSDFVLDSSQPLDLRKTIFVGGVPRPLRACELALIMNRLYGGVCYAGIDTDPELKYPKGAGRVAFSSQQSYIAAIGARFVQLRHGSDIDKRVEVKPYVLDDQMCDECGGAMCAGKYAPFFCANVACLQYYCEHCWAAIHDSQGRQFHKPLVKEGADRPRAVPYRW